MEARCPPCGTPLVERRVGKLRLLACPNEHGALLPHGSRPALTFAAKAALEEAIERPRGEAIPCASCGTRTQRIVAARHGDHIELDHCYQCAGVWFDAGEVERLQAQAPRGRHEVATSQHRAMALYGGADAAAGVFQAAPGLVELIGSLLDGW